MNCRSRALVNVTETTKTFVSDFTYENLEVKTIKSYDDIKNHFTNFKIDERYESFITSESNHSLSYVKILLRNKENEDDNWINLLSLTVETDQIISPTYTYHFRQDIYDEEPGSFINFLKENPNLENFFINIEMDTIFYLHLVVGIDSDDDEEETTTDDNSDTSAIIEDIFKTEECSVCLLNNPTILYYPCLHLSVCKPCEENGKFKYCVICRGKVYRKAFYEKMK